MRARGDGPPSADEQAIRAFLAIAPSDALRARLGDLVRTMKTAAWSHAVRWVPESSLHLTLRFLGEVSRDVLEALDVDVARVAGRHAAHRASITGVGPFPNARRPSVIALGLTADAALDALAADLEHVAIANGLTPERRRFRPHVTLGRVREALPRSVATDAHAAYAASGLDGLDWEVDAVLVERSDLSPRGARYAVLARHALAPARGSTARPST